VSWLGLRERGAGGGGRRCGRQVIGEDAARVGDDPDVQHLVGVLVLPHRAEQNRRVALEELMRTSVPSARARVVMDWAFLARGRRHTGYFEQNP